MEKRKDPLAGMFFHSFKSDGALEWQGTVADRISDDAYLVRLFSWATGDPTTHHVVKLETMVGWTFYDNADHWKRSGDELSRAAVRKLELKEKMAVEGIRRGRPCKLYP